MAEPSSAIPYLVLGGSSVAAAFPGLDPLTVIGSGGGAGMFCMMAYWIPNFWVKFAYFFIAWAFGYIYAVQGPMPAIFDNAPGIRGFIASFLIVILCTAVIEFVRTNKLPGWIGELGKLRLSRKGDPDA
jgi:hypothetical protein